VEGNFDKFIGTISVLFNPTTFHQWRNVKSVKINTNRLLHFTYNEFEIYEEIEAFHNASWQF